MKIRIILFLTLISSPAFAQNASTYFPVSPGYKWNFKVIPLDSLNQPQEQFTTYRIDSFSVIQDYKGLNAHYIPSKRNLIIPNQPAPYSDTTFLNFNGTNAWEYVNLTNGLDTIPFIQGTGIIQFLKSMENWYSVYRFAQTVNLNYTILTKDTTIQIDTLTLPLRFTITGRRLNDQTLNTVLGTFTAKKFIITQTLSYLVTIPPFPPIAVPIVTRPDSSYVVSAMWILRTVTPSSNIDLSLLGIPLSFYIPGQTMEIFDPAVSVSNNTSNLSGEFKLYQNYPNPFNPSTIISYWLKENADVSLKIFNILGKEVMTLVNERQSAGSYSIEWDARGFPSGAYLYKLKTDNFSDMKLMMLLK